MLDRPLFKVRTATNDNWTSPPASRPTTTGTRPGTGDNSAAAPRSPYTSPLMMRSDALPSRPISSASFASRASEAQAHTPFVKVFSSRDASPSIGSRNGPRASSPPISRYSLKMMRLLQEAEAEFDESYSCHSPAIESRPSTSRGVPRSPTYPMLIASYRDAAARAPEGSDRRDYLERSVATMAERYARVGCAQRILPEPRAHMPGWRPPRESEWSSPPRTPVGSTDDVIVSEAMRQVSLPTRTRTRSHLIRAAEPPWGRTHVSGSALSPELRLR